MTIEFARSSRSRSVHQRTSGHQAMVNRTDARIVIVGGGIIGLGIAYHLARLGVTDVMLVERNQLTSGTSWRTSVARSSSSRVL